MLLALLLAAADPATPPPPAEPPPPDLLGAVRELSARAALLPLWTAAAYIAGGFLPALAGRKLLRPILAVAFGAAAFLAAWTWVAPRLDAQWALPGAAIIGAVAAGVGFFALNIAVALVAAVVLGGATGAILHRTLPDQPWLAPLAGIGVGLLGAFAGWKAAPAVGMLLTAVLGGLACGYGAAGLARDVPDLAPWIGLGVAGGIAVIGLMVQARQRRREMPDDG